MNQDGLILQMFNWCCGSGPVSTGMPVKLVDRLLKKVHSSVIHDRCKSEKTRKLILSGGGVTQHRQHAKRSAVDVLRVQVYVSALTFETLPVQVIAEKAGTFHQAVQLVWTPGPHSRAEIVRVTRCSEAAGASRYPDVALFTGMSAASSRKGRKGLYILYCIGSLS